MEVIEALGVSFSCIFVIYLLDKIADLEETGPEVDEVIRESVMGFGLLIGFCWEHAFNHGISAMVGRFDVFPEIMQFLACSFLAMVVLPAYVMYIHPVQFRLTEAKLAADHAEEEHAAPL
jgi:hypothetical protein